MNDVLSVLLDSNCGFACGFLWTPNFSSVLNAPFKPGVKSILECGIPEVAVLSTPLKLMSLQGWEGGFIPACL
jgi:hypothetical protein